PAGRPDPALAFTAPADGHYTVEVASRFRSLGGPEYAYRLRLARPAPADFHLRLAADAVTVPRGGQAALKVLVERGGGFNEPAALALVGLPAGVTAPSVTVAPGQPAVDVPLKAGPRSEIGSFLLTVRGTAKRAGR